MPNNRMLRLMIRAEKRKKKKKKRGGWSLAAARARANTISGFCPRIHECPPINGCVGLWMCSGTPVAKKDAAKDKVRVNRATDWIGTAYKT